MGNLFENTNAIVKSYIDKGKFYLCDLEDEIHTQDGIMRVAPGLTVKEHLDDLADEGVLVKEISLYKNSGKHEIHYSINKDFKPNYELFNIPDIM